MNRKMVFYVLGQLLSVEAGLLVLPMLTALYYKENCFISLLITAGIALTAGLLLMAINKRPSEKIYPKEGFIITSLSWLVLSAIGALPFVISGEIPSYIDAFFETVSGFTTTGASVLDNVEAMSKGLLFWRSFTHWVGGMGVLVFVVALTKSVSDRSIHIMRAEMPGPIVDKLVPRTKDTAKILYIIYLVMTVAEIIILFAGGMPLYDSIVHTFGTAGTGGFGIKGDSIGSYNNFIQWVIAVFMILFGVNFNIYYLIVVRKFKDALKSSELYTYLSIILFSTVIVAINIYPQYKNISDTARLSFFQVSSIMTTTGFSTADFDTWGVLSKTVLVILMFIGACAGSTAGGLKVSRIMIYYKMVKREFRRLLHPRAVDIIRLDGKRVDESTVSTQGAYFAVYIAIFFATFFILGFDKFDIETNFTAVAACFNNIGPGLAKVGPSLSFSGYSAVSKLVLSFAMLLGRLEIFPLILAIAPSTWTKK